MGNKLGRITAIDPAPAATTESESEGAQPQSLAAKGATTTTATSTGGSGDTSLPDPTLYAKIFLVVSIAATVGVSILLAGKGWDSRTFAVPKTISTQFGLIAGFYVAAQVIERLMELIAPLVPWWHPLTSSRSGLTGGASPEDDSQGGASPQTGSASAAYTKADRAACCLGITSLLGVAASAAFGLYFLAKFGIHTHRWVDIFVSGVVIGGGTKPLHDFISLIQSKSNPVSGSGTS